MYMYVYQNMYIYIYIYLSIHLSIVNCHCHAKHVEGSLEVKFPTMWTDETQRWEEAKKKVRRES